MQTESNKITILGDSIMKGVFYNPCSSSLRDRYILSSDPIPTRCSRSLGIECVNLGRFGSTIVQGVEQLNRNSVTISNSKYTLLEFGGNDSDYDWQAIAHLPQQQHSPHTPLQIYKDTYRYAIRKIREAGSEPVILTLPPLDAERYFQFFTMNMTLEEKGNILKWLGGSISTISMGHELFNIETIKLAYSEGVSVIDITSAFLSIRNMSVFFCQDGIHPNESGQALIAEKIIEAFSAKVM